MTDYPLKETIHSMLRRCVGWDYTKPCIYMITVVLADRRGKALGTVLADRIGDRGLPAAAHCEPTDLGRAVEGCWEAIPRFYPQVQILGKQVMPDHFHGILWVKEPLDCHLGQVVKGFKLGCNKAARALSSAMASPITGLGKGLFAEGFQDTILFSRGQLEKMITYIQANPLRLAVKRAMPELFTMVRDVRIPVILSPTAEPADLHFSAIGNLGLLDRPLVQVQCSRRHLNYRRVPKPGGGLKIARDAQGEPIVEFATSEYENRRDELLAAGRHGAALISPCISDGERQIAREALKEGLPLVTMQNKGFSKLQKPSGRYFDACAAGRLLMIAPAAWPHMVGEKRMTRDDALAMNRLCQWLAGEGAATIDYKGHTPVNIDRMALDATRSP
ncbi:MAG: hypothetical protein IJR99_13905 [Kiritimatiellae bacterium]|nr:hypothetical protein [Kiritimatiellia bacterium]